MAITDRRPPDTAKFKVDENGRMYNVYDVDIGTDYPNTLHAGWLCRAWVNFDGTGTFSPNPSTTKIRASANVSSITKNGTGDYTVNFGTAMPDANYTPIATAGNAATVAGYFVECPVFGVLTVNNVRCSIIVHTGSIIDANFVNLGIFR